MYDLLCPGCGHRTAMILIDNIIETKKLKEKVVMMFDVACCSLLIDFVNYDSVMCAHGRVLDVTKGYKEMRKENIVVSYMGDGAAYSIGIEEMIHAARRNDDAIVIVINNGLYAMTGGQISPTNVGAMCHNSRGERECSGEYCEPFHIENVIGNFPISYFSRAALSDKDNIDLAKKYMEKVFDNYIKFGGFNMIELLSPCPTNYKLSPKDMSDKINNEWSKVYKIGELVNNV